MDKKMTPEELDRYLRKFAIDGQEKLVNQLRQMVKEAAAQKQTDPVSRQGIYDTMDVYHTESQKFDKSAESENSVSLEIICRPYKFGKNIEVADVKMAIRRASRDGKYGRILFAPPDDSNLKVNENNNVYAYKSNGPSQFQYFALSPDKAEFYSRNTTQESEAGHPKIFDPASEVLSIGEAILIIGPLYQILGLNYCTDLHIGFRYMNALNMLVGSTGPDYFLPSDKYKNEQLTLYVARSLQEILGKPAQIATDIIFGLLGKLRYQGIVRKDYFIHAFIKHFAKR